MKKLVGLCAMVFMLMGTKTYAESFNVMIDKKNIKVNEVAVEIDNNKLNTEYSAYTATGRTFVPIRELTESLGAKVDWNNKNKSATVELNGKTVKLKINSNVVYLNGKKTIIDKDSIPKFAFYISKNNETKTMVPLRFLSEAFGYNVNWDQKEYKASVSTKPIMNTDNKDTRNNDLKTINYVVTVTDQKNDKNENDKKNPDEGYGFDFSTEVNNNNNSSTQKKDNDGESKTIKRTISKKIKLDGPLNIVIDPGHGGKDSGALGYQEKTKEKDFTLKIGKKLYNKLRDNGINAYLTRDDDYFVTLDGRAEMANKLNAQLYLSIHMNATDNSDANGIEVFYAPAGVTPIKDTEQIYFAKALDESLIKSTGAFNRGVKDGRRLVVLRKTKGVAALAELGFITNENEVNKLQTEEYQDLLVDALYNGIKDYINNYVE